MIGKGHRLHCSQKRQYIYIYSGKKYRYMDIKVSINDIIMSLCTSFKRRFEEIIIVKKFKK